MSAYAAQSGRPALPAGTPLFAPEAVIVTRDVPSEIQDEHFCHQNNAAVEF
jgi:hypothetical protein